MPETKGGILSGPEIRRLVELGGPDEHGRAIRITPYDRENAGPNSYDVTLSPELLVYSVGWGGCLDMLHPNKTRPLTIPPSGLVIHPGRLYLGATVEEIEAHGCVPWVDGRSSLGRLGVQIHSTAGKGDDGWKGAMTFEISCVQPVRIYGNVLVGQVLFFTLVGERQPYKGRYQGDATAVPSRLWQGIGHQQGAE